MPIKIKDIIICAHKNETHYFDLSPYYANWYGVLVGSLPAGIEAAQDSITNSVIGFIVTYNSLATGSHTVTIEGFKDLEDGESLGQFTLVFTKGACAHEEDACCGDSETATLLWLGREGGIKQWPFPGFREFRAEVGDALTFKNSNGQMQYSERKNIHAGYRLTTKSITQEQLLFISEIKVSIQAWAVGIAGEITPILLVNESFPLYNSKQKFYDVSASFIDATETIYQTQ